MSWRESPFWRTARRWLVVASGGAVSALISYFGDLPPEQQAWFIPLATAVLVAIDKAIREEWNV